MKNLDEPSTFVSHKFIPLDKHRWSSLESSKFYFSSPESLNDPADCQIDLVKAFHIARKGLGYTYQASELRAFMSFAREVQCKAKTIGIFSLSSGRVDGEQERLMWSHYADNHRGVCLTFEIPTQFVFENLVGCAPVQYSADALMSALRNLDLTRKPEFEADIKPILSSWLATKSDEWAYEKEARLIAFSAGLQLFERSWLKKICFGLRTDMPNRIRVKELVQSYPACTLSEMYVKEDGLFDLGVRDVS